MAFQCLLWLQQYHLAILCYSSVNKRKVLSLVSETTETYQNVFPVSPRHSCATFPRLLCWHGPMIEFQPVDSGKKRCPTSWLGQSNLPHDLLLSLSSPVWWMVINAQSTCWRCQSLLNDYYIRTRFSLPASIYSSVLSTPPPPPIKYMN